jgi:hypothetical protein
MPAEDRLSPAHGMSGSAQGIEKAAIWGYRTFEIWRFGNFLTHIDGIS